MQRRDHNTEVLCFKRNHIWSGLTLTDTASQKICRLMANDSGMLGLRLTIKQSGCAGFGYVVERVIKVDDSDLVYEHDNAILFVALKAMPFVDGTEVDYVQEGLNHMFKFNNPKARHWCGCGASFHL